MRESAPSAPEASGSEATQRGRIAASWVAVAAWAVVIFCVSANTGAELSAGDGIVSRVFRLVNAVAAQAVGHEVDVASPAGHFCEYAVFGALLANALRWHLPLRRACALAVVAASAYGVTDELHQWFVPGRTADPADWLLDTAAAALGSVAAGRLCRAVLRRRAGREG